MSHTKQHVVSSTDQLHLALLRDHVTALFTQAGAAATAMDSCEILDIAPQDHGGVRPFLTETATLQTFDIDPQSGADIIGDICERNDGIDDDSFDIVVCTEVLEHVSNPFAAITEIRRILKPAGIAYFSAPFDFRIHGPLPDSRRFSEHGWRHLLTDFSSVDIRILETPDRDLMPIHYAITAAN